jgi:hypothetical protein
MKIVILIFLFSGCLGSKKLPMEKQVVLTEEERIMKSLDDDTLLGPDKNNDGVRDDVEYWIKRNTPNDNVRLASLLFAKYYRLMRINLHSRERSNELMRKKRVVSDCIFLLNIHNKSYQTGRIPRQILSLVNNKKNRIEAYYQTDRYYRGQTYSTSGDSAEEVCPFKLRK